ncbi:MULTISPECIES: Fic family protein [unclassified Methanoregula]|uniref:Fic family protein n=1 Tax=unclassified Methanoregula TaxID=2649730 RepID=UPI0009C678A0|nr:MULTISPECIES: Fic family protein [unclassified Methanoregula]OPX62200.1 MAG: Fic/DOC family protein [Methanoregula sp. PtaB.Bin085]OPY35591.1 MAG: Fic/DOC family protein [Methanoregula sp. PtaU1.Bin006]
MKDTPAFVPVFTYSHDMVRRLAAITAAREVILHAHLVPKWEVSVRREQLVRAAHASTAIEGNPLSLEEVSRLADGREVMASRRARAEVLNYLHVLEHIGRYRKKQIVSETEILALHRDITRDTLDDPAAEGAFRTVRVVVGNRRTKEVVFSPPAPGEVRPQVERLVAWLNSDDARRLHPVLVAGLAHYELVRIHPFVDGNGRTARALATLVLTMREFDTRRFFTLDDFYDSDRNAYYTVLKRTNGTYPDCTAWLEYFLEGVEISLSRVKERVLLLSSDEHRKAARGQVALSERQMRIIEFIHANGSVKSGDLVSMFRISRQAALRELTSMMEKDLILREGDRRGARYVLR